MSAAGHPLPDAPWGLVIGLYFVLGGLASGITLFCGWLRSRGEAAPERLDWPAGWIALLTLAACGLILVADLGRPARFFLMLTALSNPGSVMAFGARLIALKGALLALYLLLLHRRRRSLAAGDASPPVGAARALLSITPGLLAVTSLGVAVYPVFLLSRTWGSPLAASPGAALIFLSTAVLMGAAVAAMLAAAVPAAAGEALLSRVRGALLLLVSAEALLLVLEGLALYGDQPALVRAMRDLVGGRLSGAFWGLVVIAGVIVPAAGLALLPKRRPAVLASAVAALVGAGATRYLFFVVR